MQSKSILAKLLANENITIRHGNFPTAYFDVQERVLGLPVYKDFGSKDTLDLFIGHEVGHALYTPFEGWHDSPAEVQVPRSFLNVVEDIRIERKIQSKYPGLVSVFKRGYKTLVDQNFFHTKGRDLQEYQLIDRINLKAKMRDLVDIDFAQEEMPYVKQAFAAETWDEVVAAAKAIYEFMRENDENKDDAHDDNSDNQFQEGMESSEDSSEDSTESTETYDAEESQVEPSSESEKDSDEEFIDEDESTDTTTDDKEAGELDSSELDSKVDDFTSETDDALRENEKLFVEGSDSDELVMHIRELTWEQCKSCIYSYSEVKESRDKHRSDRYFTYNKDHTADFAEFQSETNKITSILAKEFEMRKAAYRYSRAKTSKTGALNVNMLHSYKYNEDIFKKVTQLADAKSHGMVMMIDYSGSMQQILGDTIKQVLNLASFCKKVNIPFEVYGFTSRDRDEHVANADYSINTLQLSHVRITELLNSSMKKSEYNEAYFGLYETSDKTDQYSRSELDRLGTTPLNECLLVMNKILQRFRNKNAVQRVNFVLLSDGFGGKMEVSYPWADYAERRRLSRYSIEFNGKTIFTQSIDPLDVTAFLLDQLRKNDISTIGFFLAETGRELYSINDLVHKDIKAWYDRSKYAEIMKTNVRKNKFHYVDNKIGYDRLFILKASKRALSTDVDELSIDENASKAKIISSFKKYSSSKKTNRILATKFAEIVS